MLQVREIARFCGTNGTWDAACRKCPWEGLREGPSSVLILTYTLFDFTDTRIADDDFFLNDALTGWQLARMGISQISGSGVFVRNVRTAQMVLPEPGTGLLLLTGLLGLAYRRRRSALPSAPAVH